MFKYVRTFLITILRTVLKFLIRRIAWLIILALLTNFFEDIRRKMLEYIETFRAKIKEACELIRDALKKLVEKITLKLDELVGKINELIEFFRGLIAFLNLKIELIDNKVAETKQIFEIPEIKQILEDKNITIPNFTALDEIKAKIATTNTKIDEYNDILTTSRNEIVEKLEEIPLSRLTGGCEIIDERINHILDSFTLEELKKLLELGLDKKGDTLEDVIDEVDFSGVLDNEEQTFLKNHKWLKLKHTDKPKKDSKDWRLNDIYRILVINFSREERLALATQLGKKDYLKKKGKKDKSKWA